MNAMTARREIVRFPSGPPQSGGSTARPTVVRGGEFLFLSGLTAIDLETGKPMLGTTASETRHILRNLKTLLEAAGSSLDKVVKTTVLLHSMLEAPNMNDVYAGFFSDPPPARTVCGVSLPDRIKVMIECVALV
jgi:2-iminobutanoate/2-iminopropanoate deaminase